MLSNNHADVSLPSSHKRVHWYNLSLPWARRRRTVSRVLQGIIRSVGSISSSFTELISPRSTGFAEQIWPIATIDRVLSFFLLW